MSITGRPRVGCSGWSYPDWSGIVYPVDLPRSRWFEHYTSLFDTVELNTTFYRLPELATVQRWADRTPSGFEYAAKLGRFGTHRKKLIDPEPWLARHLERMEPLRHLLGPTLVQLPPRWRCNAPRLDEFLAVAPSTMRWAVELRDPSWLTDEVFEVLARHGAALCIHDLLVGHPLIRTTGWAYLRFHGVDPQRDPYRGAYTGRRLWRLAEVLQAWLDEGTDVYAYFNNDHGGAAVLDAGWLRDRLTESGHPR
jgi:uncharacterized protein YecE (DUF72 family)